MLLFNAAVLVVTGCTLWAMRTEALSNGLEMSRTYAGNFENYVSQSLRATETSLAQAVQLKNNAIALRETQTTLQVLQQQSPSLRSLTLIDDENRVVLSSNPANVGLTLAASSPWFTSDAHTQEARIGGIGSVQRPPRPRLPCRLANRTLFRCYAPWMHRGICCGCLPR
jgi:hypothetical protein